MTKQLYEEALADVKKVKQVAEDNAKRAVMEVVTPLIHKFIDQALLNEHELDGDEMVSVAPGALPVGGELMTDLVAIDPTAAVPVDAAGPAAAISPPDAQGKVTLDIDALCGAEAGAPVASPLFGDVGPLPDHGGGAEYEVSLESLESLKPVIANLEAQVNQIKESINLFKNAGRVVRSTSAYREQIAQMISRVENMYDHVQEQVTDPAKKSSYETMLEAGFKVLNKLQESTTMSQKTNKGRINESDVTLKLTGLPDDIDLDTVGVDLISGEDEEGLEDGGDQQAGLDDLDGMGGQDQFGGEQQMETRRLSDDTIVEIDENMLRREIARMKNLREDHSATGGSETKAQSWGNGPDHFDSFGGGKDEGEPTDAEIVDKSPAPAALPLGEADGDLDEGDELSEGDDEDLDEGDVFEADGLEEAVDGPDHGGNQKMPTNKQSRHPGESAAVTRNEGLKRLSFEKKLQERAKVQAASLKKEAAAAKAKRNAKRFAEVKKEYALVAKRFNESLVRAKKMTQIVAEATKKLQESRSNSGTAQPAENTAENATLRKKLAETNLFNAKLLFTNKLLQNEQLTARQKAQVIRQLDSAKTIREAKLVYESLANTLAGTSKPVNESAQNRQVLGSSSKATRPASTQTLNEGYEAERWAQLAGITKR